MTASDIIKMMLIKRHMKSLDLCNKLNCSQQALSNKMNRSSWKLSTFLDIVKACDSELIIRLPDNSEFKVESGADNVQEKINSEPVYNGAEKSKEMPEKMSAFQFQGEGDYATKKKNNRSKKGHSSNSISDTSTKKNMVKADPVRKAKQLEGQMNFLDSNYLDDM